MQQPLHLMLKMLKKELRSESTHTVFSKPVCSSVGSRGLTADVLKSRICQRGRGGWTLRWSLSDVQAAVTAAAECKHEWSFVWTWQAERRQWKPGWRRKTHCTLWWRRSIFWRVISNLQAREKANKIYMRCWPVFSFPLMQNSFLGKKAAIFLLFFNAQESSVCIINKEHNKQVKVFSPVND